jgi:hypothetical protein
MHAAAGDVGDPAQMLNRGARHGFQPDRLQDPGGAVIPDDVRVLLPVLLAAGLANVVRVILGTDDEGLGLAVGVEKIGRVEPEGHVTALVVAEERAIEPDRCAVVNRSEVHEKTLTLHAESGRSEVSGGHLSAVPHHGMESGVSDPGC